MNLSSRQVDKLSDYCMRVAEGSLIAAIALPVVSSTVSVIASVKMIGMSIAFLLMALWITNGKGNI